ncbi:MAG: hypothetical protein NVS3B26_13200 [Mycobacteriales bacterium]
MRRLLLVDDDALIRLLVTSVLAAAGEWVTIEAASLGEAQELLSAGPVPDVVVLDESLPDGSGLDLVVQIRTLPGRCMSCSTAARGSAGCRPASTPLCTRAGHRAPSWTTSRRCGRLRRDARYAMTRLVVTA